MDESLKLKIGKSAASIKDEIIGIRRHLHRYPELSCLEVKTAEFICQKLDAYGIRYQKEIAGTGVVGFIEGRNPSARCIALRADMDALPVTEISLTEYSSTIPGVMHACGHDVHMACLLGAAKILAGLTSAFTGTVKLIFQPSEETFPGGAIAMIEAGVLENPAPEFVIGQHVINNLDAGEIGLKPGPYMASTDEIYITVKGKGGHSATPNQVIDPVLIASHIVVALQQIVSRNADPVMPTVISFGKIMGNGRTNVIPDEVTLDGTVRTYNETWRKEVHERIRKMAVSIASGMGGSCDVRIAPGYPFLYNDPDLTLHLEILAREYLGTDKVKTLEQRMTAEDFAYYAAKVPSCLFRLGIRNQSRGINSNLHTATFDVDEDSIATGMEMLAWFTINLLSQENPSR
ncbi:MAG TPA: M20 family metallopeptidase [Bacteroidales bacterium]|nr:M20 family metallopeptidase [Bacteroidales bacterium]HPS49655.1 M20 family metallopeptidase [Bacteroidales bacterium]